MSPTNILILRSYLEMSSTCRTSPKHSYLLGLSAMLGTPSHSRMEPVPFVIAMVPSWGRSPNGMACTKLTGGNSHQCLHNQQVAVLPLWTPTNGLGISHPTPSKPLHVKGSPWGWT